MKAPDWLAHLRTDRVGRPVPLINRWGLTEKPDLVRIRWDRLVGGPAVFYDDQDETEPDFTSQNISRQRESVIDGRCQVCWRQVPWSRRFLVISTVSVGQVTSPGPAQGAVTVNEPWLDERCATFAMRYCPALLRRADADDLTLISVTSKKDVDILIGTGAIDGFPETWHKPVAQWATIAVKNMRHNTLAPAR